MIQLLNFSTSTATQSNTFYLNTQSLRVSDESTTIYYLASLENIMKNTTSFVIASKGTINARYSALGIALSSVANTVSLQRGGQVNVGNVEGFYNFNLYEQTSATNLDPTDSSVKATLYQGLAYIKSGDAEVSYSSYSTTDTNTVYIP